MHERPVNVVEDDLDWIVWLELEGSLIGSEGKLISGSQRTSFLSEFDRTFAFLSPCSLFTIKIRTII